MLCLAAAGLGAAPPLLAAESIQVTADQSTLISLPDLPATVVVGNPSIADVTLDGQIMFVHPRGPGLTNIVVLGNNGAPIADYQVHVIYDDPDSLAVYSPGGRDTYSCTRDCAPVVRVGDNQDFFNAAAGQVKAKSELAASQAPGGEAPTVPIEVPVPTP
jgi:hypothetical protein